MITAPFNFVPLSEKVFFPDWAEEVSHDVPFEDAQSGVIDITMTAKSPLFVRDHNDEEKFCNHNGTQYIPGPSVKGMVRNVLEIMSFSKIPIDSKTHAKTMSVRDMSNRNELVGTASGCGFLKKDAEGKWIIVDYGRPRTIGYEDIRDKTIHIDNESVSLNFETAEEKYNVVGLYKEILVQKDTKDLIDRNDRKIGTKDNGTLENDKYQTLMDKGARIAGWKRYPLHFNQPKVKSIEPTDSSTTFTPIGTYNGDKFNEFTFTGKVRFHNLKTLELGALVSALTFHNNSEEFLHNIGMAKSLGFGKIQISLDTDQYSEQLQKYELFMNDWTQENIKENWIESVQLKELFSMAYSQLNIDSKLVYLKLDPENRINKFADAKKGKECLPKVSKLFNMQDNYPQSLLTQEVLDNYEEIKREKQVEEEFSRRFKEANSTDNIQIIKNFIQDYPSYESIEILEEKVQRIERSKIEDKHSEANKKAKLAYETLQKKKSNQKQYAKELDKFLKKWKADKNNKGSEFVLDLIKKLT